MSETMSAASVTASYPVAGLPLAPVPRRSAATTVWCSASAGITWRHPYQNSGHGGSNSSGGPSPPMTA